MAYGVFKDLTRRRTSHKILHNKACNIAKNPKYGGYQMGIAEIISNKELAEESHKTIIKKFKKNEKYAHLL